MGDTRHSSEIKEFYRDTSVLVTGGTGFLGKVVIEKLLRSCPGIKKIYVLCRPKNGKDVNSRLDKQLDGALYDIVKKTNPDFKSKIVPVAGDLAQISLDISKEDEEMLVDEIDIILHCAATVRFDEELRKAVRINIRGTRDLFLLARGMKRLKALVHVSTAYSNCIHHHIEEKLYERPFDGDVLTQLVEAVDEETISKITPGLVGKYPNTYTFSKAIAEDIVKQNSEVLPVCIVRPSTIISTCKEPFAGWCDNLNGPMGAATSIFLGFLHTWPGDPNKIAPLVPVDLVANTTIVAAWDVAQVWDIHRQNETTSSGNLRNNSEIPIYNCTGCAEHALTWGDFVRRKIQWSRTIPMLKCVWVNFMDFNKYKYMDLMYLCLFHFLPAYIVDGLLLCTIGKKPSYVKNYKLIHKTRETLSYFTSNEWKFGNGKIRNLFAKLNDADKKLFNFDMSDMSWSEYVQNFVIGIRVHILKDPLSTVPRARRKYMMLRVLSKILMITLVFALYYFWVLLNRIF